MLTMLPGTGIAHGCLSMNGTHLFGHNLLVEGCDKPAHTGPYARPRFTPSGEKIDCLGDFCVCPVIKVLTWEDCAKACSTWDECDAFGFQEVAMDPQHTVYFLPKLMSKPEEGSCRGVISRSQWKLLSKAHKVILAASSPMFPRRNRHPHPLIYVWGLNFNPYHIDQWMGMRVSFGKYLKSTQGTSHFSPVCLV